MWIFRCCSLIFLTMMSLEHCASTNPAWDDIIDSLTKIHAKEVLTYGDSCSFETEKQRLEIYSNIDLVELIEENPEELRKLSDKLRALASTAGKLCDSTNFLACGSNGLCDCANFDISGISFNSSAERLDPRNRTVTCKLIRGSTCLPEEAVGMLTESHFRCGFDTTCVLKSTGRDCTSEAIAYEIVQIIVDSGIDPKELTPRDVAKLIFEQFRNKICQCGNGN